MCDLAGWKVGVLYTIWLNIGWEVGVLSTICANLIFKDNSGLNRLSMCVDICLCCAYKLLLLI